MLNNKKNCWEIKGCGREPVGKKEKELGCCPASIDRSSNELNGGLNGGRICWAVAGTLCGGLIQGTFAEKKLTCMNCEFFLLVKSEELNDFKLLRPGQTYKKAQIKK